MLHIAIFDDVVGDTHVMRDRTLDEIHGRVGPRMPIVLDGIAGELTAEPDDIVRFVPAEPPN